MLMRLRDINASAYEPLMKLDVPAVEDWVSAQQQMLADLADTSALRADIQERCLPSGARGIAGSGGLATTVTLHALIGRAPREIAGRLRQQRDHLRQLRDEIAILSTRNEVLISQVLSFTDHLGEELVNEAQEPAYTASGKQANTRHSGELFTSAI